MSKNTGTNLINGGNERLQNDGNERRQKVTTTATITCTDGCKAMMNCKVLIKDGMKIMMTNGLITHKKGHQIDKEGKIIGSNMMMYRKM